MASKWITAGPWVIVLATGLIWFGREAGVLHQLKQNQQALRKRIYAAQSPTGKETLSKGKIDWKGMLSRDLDSPSDFGMGDVRLTIGLRQRALEMTGQELISEIDRIAASDADYTKKHSLEVILLGALIQREPMLLLSKLSKPMGVDFSNIWAYNAAFRNYLRQDPSAAIAWLDQNSRDKTLSDFWRSFEQMTMEQAVETDPGAAKARLMALPEEDRSRVLSGAPIEPGREAAWADLIRTGFPSSESDDAIATAFAGRADRSLDDVNRLLNTISASAGEKEAIVRTSMTRYAMDPDSQYLDLGRLDEARTWAMGKSPESVDQTVGALLGGVDAGPILDGELPLHPNFEEAAQAALRYAAESNDDAVLEAFLEGSGAGTHAAEALLISQKISDPDRREEIRRKLEERLHSAPGSSSSE